MFDHIDPSTLDKDQQFNVCKAMGMTETQAEAYVELLASGIVKSFAQSANPSGDGSADASTHDDKASQEKVRAKEGNAKTVPASESNKSGAPRDEMMEEEAPEDEEGGDEEGEDEEYAPAPARKSAKKSFGDDYGDDYAYEYVEALTKNLGGDEMKAAFDGSVALSAMADTNADLYGEQAFQISELRREVRELTKSLSTLVKEEGRKTRAKTIESHNTNVRIIKSVNEEMGDLKKSLRNEPAGTVATGVVAQVPQSEKRLAKSHGAIALGADFRANKNAISAHLNKSLATKPEARTEVLEVLGKVDLQKSTAALASLIEQYPTVFEA